MLPFKTLEDKLRYVMKGVCSVKQTYFAVAYVNRTLNGLVFHTARVNILVLSKLLRLST